MLQTSSLKFLRDLKKNNNKPWFDASRNRYEEARKDFEHFIQQVIDALGKKDKTIAGMRAKDCMFRINRDIRFSKDKSPYKTNFGASINKGGRIASFAAGYYFHLETGHSFAGGGIYRPMPDVLKKIRQEIDYNFDALKKITGSKKFKSIYSNLDKSAEFLLSRVPKGYEPDNPAAEYLKLKSFTAIAPVSNASLVSPDLVRTTVALFDILQPLVVFLNNSIE